MQIRFKHNFGVLDNDEIERLEKLTWNRYNHQNPKPPNMNAIDSSSSQKPGHSSTSTNRPNLKNRRVIENSLSSIFSNDTVMSKLTVNTSIGGIGST